MTAFKYLTKNSVELVTDCDHSGSHLVYVYLKSGKLEPVHWIGFKRRDDPVGFPAGSPWRYVKMPALSVSHKSGAMSDRWRILLASEYVVCLMVMYSVSYPGVYALVDDRGWPIVMSHNTPQGCIKKQAVR